MTSYYMPFFREGRLCLPPATCQLLIDSGFNADWVPRAGKGLHLDDDRPQINAIYRHLQTILDTLDPMIRDALSSQDVEYMLSYTNLEDLVPA